MKKILKIIDRLDGYIAAFFLFITVALLSIQVFNRYLLGISLSWTEELSRFTFVWCVYFGVSMAVRSGEHVRVVAHLKAMLPFRVYTLVVFFSDLVWLAFSCIMLVASIQFINTTIEFPFISPALGVPMFWVYLIIPLIFALMIIRLVQVNYLRIKKGASGFEETLVDPGL